MFGNKDSERSELSEPQKPGQDSKLLEVINVLKI
jgi:hypothetical protein